VRVDELLGNQTSEHVGKYSTNQPSDRAENTKLDGEDAHNSMARCPQRFKNRDLADAAVLGTGDARGKDDEAG
jgi:hypothetical protein